MILAVRIRRVASRVTAGERRWGRGRVRYRGVVGALGVVLDARPSCGSALLGPVGRTRERRDGTECWRNRTAASVRALVGFTNPSAVHAVREDGIAGAVGGAGGRLWRALRRRRKRAAEAGALPLATDASGGDWIARAIGALWLGNRARRTVAAVCGLPGVLDRRRFFAGLRLAYSNATGNEGKRRHEEEKARALHGSRRARPVPCAIAVFSRVLRLAYAPVWATGGAPDQTPGARGAPPPASTMDCSSRSKAAGAKASGLPDEKLTRESRTSGGDRS